MLGTVSEALDGSGNVTGSRLYDAYGNGYYGSGSMPGSYGFTGQHSDVGTTGLDDYGARFYDPSAAQFTSADTMRDGQSSYAYVGGNPESFVDPSGHSVVTDNQSQGNRLDLGQIYYQRAMHDRSYLVDLWLHHRDAWAMAEAYAQMNNTSLVEATGVAALAYRQSKSSDYWNSSGETMKDYTSLSWAIGLLAAETTGTLSDIHGGGEGGDSSDAAAAAAADPSLMGGDALEGGDPMLGDAPLMSDDDPQHGMAHSTEDGAGDSGGGACSFSADTLVATPSGEQSIGTLQVGDAVTAYDPSSGQTSTQTVQHVWINHDTDLLDVTLASDPSAGKAASQGGTSKPQEVAFASHGLRAPPTEDNGSGDSASAAIETVHTTANHPWLTADRGWVAAGQLAAGERVVREDGTLTTIVALRDRPGVADYYNLTVSQLHTFAVGSGRYVVHNCGVSGNAPGVPGDPSNKVVGQPNLYHGQAANPDELLSDGWQQTRMDSGPIQQNVYGQDFSAYLRSQGKSTSGWRYFMETWVNPRTKQTIENHYWSDQFENPTNPSYYHHH